MTQLCGYFRSDSKIPETTAVVDTIYLDSGGTEYNIEKYFVHHFYNKILSLNDIALINLKENIEFSETVQPIKLAEGNTEPGVDLVLCGWGRTSVNITRFINKLHFYYLLQ